MSVTRILLTLVAFQLTACGSGTSDRDASSSATSTAESPQNGGAPWVHFEGVWQGTITPDETMSSQTAILLVNGWGEFRLLAPGLQLVGFPHRTRTELLGSVIGLRSPGSTWYDGTRASVFTIDGKIDDDNFISAHYTGDGGSGTIALAAITAAHSTSLGAVVGTWVQLDENQGYTGAFDFEILGDWEASLRGSQANGCTYSGAMESWTSFNSYDIWDLEVANCPLVAGIDINGEYVGTGARIDVPDDDSDALALVLALSNDTVQLTFWLHRP